MPRTVQSFLRRRSLLAFALISLAVVSCLFWPNQHLSWLLPSASASNISAVSPGAVSFAAQQYSVNEHDGIANLTVTRTGGADNAVVGKIIWADTTTFPADYRFIPSALDNSFDPGSGANFKVVTIALQPDGKVLIGGFFTNYNGITRNCIARLNADGTLDMTFDPGGGVAWDGSGVAAGVRKILVQPDGKIIIVGQFNFYNGVSRHHIARLNANGSLDTSFDPGTGIDSSATSAVLQPDGKIIVAGGAMTQYNGTPRKILVRINSDGSLDTTYNPGAIISGGVEPLALQADGKLIVGGFFNISTDPSIKNVARFNPDGSLDTTFVSGNSGINNSVTTIAVQPDGRVLLGGYFNNRAGSSRSHIARLNSDGSLDTAFDSGTNALVSAISVQPDGKIIIGGYFDLYNNTWRGRIVRLNPADGSPDPTFNSGGAYDNGILAMEIQPDGRIVIGGDFAVYSGAPRLHIARIWGDLFVNWAAGDASDKTVQLPIEDDTLDEGSESMTFTLALLSGDATLGATPTTSLTIVDNDLTIASVAGTGVFGETGTLTAKLTSGGVALSGKSVSFTLNGNAVGSATTASNGFATLTGINLNGANAGTYSNVVGASFAGDASHSSRSKTGTLTLTKATGTVSLSNLSHTYDGTAKIPVATTTPAGKTVVFTYSRNGSNVSSPLTAGSYTVTASISDTNYQGSTTTTLVIDKAQASITLSNLSHTYDGTSKRAVATTSPSGLSGIFISYSLNGVNVGSTINAGNYGVVASLNNVNYQASNATDTLVINKATPVITWNTPSDIFFGVPLSGTQLNAFANNALGTFQYSPPAGTVLAVGTHQLSTTFTPTNALNFNSVTQSVQLKVVTPPFNLILDESGSDPNQAAAVDSLFFLKDPFSAVNEANWWNQGADKNTRVIIFVTNLQLAAGETPSSVVVNLSASNSQTYTIEAEDVRIVPGFSFTQVIFRLPDNLQPGTATIKVKAHGLESNAATIKIKG